MRASRTAVEGLVDFQTLGILLFQNKQTQASRGARLHEAVRGEHPSCTGFLDRHSEFQKGGCSPNLGSSLVWSSPTYGSCSQVRVASCLGSRPSTVLAARWAGAHRTCRAQSHCPCESGQRSSPDCQGPAEPQCH